MIVWASSVCLLKGCLEIFIKGIGHIIPFFKPLNVLPIQLIKLSWNIWSSWKPHVCLGLQPHSSHRSPTLCALTSGIPSAWYIFSFKNVSRHSLSLFKRLNQSLISVPLSFSSYSTPFQDCLWFKQNNLGVPWSAAWIPNVSPERLHISGETISPFGCLTFNLWKTGGPGSLSCVAWNPTIKWQKSSVVSPFLNALISFRGNDFVVANSITGSCVTL